MFGTGRVGEPGPVICQSTRALDLRDKIWASLILIKAAAYFSAILYGTRMIAYRLFGKSVFEERGGKKTTNGCNGVQSWHQRTQPARRPGHAGGAVHRIAPSPIPICVCTSRMSPQSVRNAARSFKSSHRQEIRNLIRHQEELEKAEHPENRLMKIEDAGEQLIVTTTDIHLPERIGKALRSAFHGELVLQYDEDGYFVRVNWHRAD